MESQTSQILSYLQEGNKITPIEALEKFGCFRLGARIFDIKAQGYDIKTEMVGDKKRYAQYSLEVPLVPLRREEEMYEIFG